MNILIISEYGEAKIKDSSVIPRVGDKVDMFYEPLPTVTSVLMWPSKERIAKLNLNVDIEAIITVS